MVASSGTWRKCGLRSSSTRIVITATGVSKNWALCHPWKPDRQPASKRPPELQNRVQTIRAGTTLEATKQRGEQKQPVIGRTVYVNDIEALALEQRTQFTDRREEAAHFLQL